MNLPVLVTNQHIEETLQHLQAAGQGRVECVVLWLARYDEDAIRVQRVYRPDQEAKADVFKIPSASMQKIMSILAAEDLMIGAQVHSHPFEAFHSRADDVWAIVRHVGALSLVVPYFAAETVSSSFLADTKTFTLIPGNHWQEVPEGQIESWLKII